MQAKIQVNQVGNSLNLSIPEAMAKSLNLKVNDTLICHLENKKLIIETVNNSDYTLDELLAEEIEPSSEIDWGKPEGEEIW
jgi:antitoxin component of MazEF toxin-antitoxin module